jgi:hypothetical protein
MIEDDSDGFQPVQLIRKSVPPPIPDTGEEPVERKYGKPKFTERTLEPPPPMPDLDVSAPGAKQEHPSRRARAAQLTLVALLVILGLVAVFQVGRIREAREREEEKPPLPAAGKTQHAAPDEKQAQDPAGPMEIDEEKEQGPPESHILSFEASASSQHRKFPASHVGDGNPATVWQEAKGDKPLRKFLFLTFPEEVTVTRIGIVIGFDNPKGRHGDMFTLNNRLKKAEIAFSDEKVMFKEFEDQRQMQYFELTPPHVTRNLKITVLDVYRGSWFYDNAIAEIEVWGYEEPSASD